jgi:transmembrane sensor
MKFAPPPPGDEKPSALDTAHDALAWARAQGAAPALMRRAAGRARRRRAAILAGVSVAAVAFAFALWRQSAPTRPAPTSIAAAPAVRGPEIRTLPDGSTVELRPGAEIAVAFGPAERQLTLVRGEAHFAVAKNPGRPFVVHASGVAVRAVGTAFAIAHGPGAIDVVVTEGRVAVARPGETSGSDPRQAEPVLLAAGEGAVVPLTPVRPVEVRALTDAERRVRLEWRVPVLEFDRTTVTEAVPLFNRHAPTPLSFAPEVGGLRLSGTLRADDVDSFLLLLRNEFGVAAEPRPGGGWHLRR